MSKSFEASLSISVTHPALPGHFPGAAVVPGVVLLEQVLQAAENWLAAPVSVRGISQVKFMAPLLPGTDARALLKLESAKLGFRIECSGRTIAQGTFLLRAEHTS
jgi:3-hydroxymyristoyl/3-hydroxydecanoyl-(acyl carrier protein) dehydratase